MPRPSMKEQRREEILDAFERCIARVGLHGSSLEAIAEEANMQRSILRHYIGNRDAILEALAERVIRRYHSETDELLSYLPQKKRAVGLVEILFHSAAATPAHTLAVEGAVISASAQNTNIRKSFAKWLEQFVDSLAAVFAEDFPNQKKGDCWDVAYGVASIYFSHDSMAPVGLPRKFKRGAKNSALRLVRSLEN